MIPQISAYARGPLAAMAHEAGHDSSKSTDRVRVSVSCIRVRNWRVYKVILQTIKVAIHNLSGGSNSLGRKYRIIQ
jgi:hypothetical protein